MTTDSNNGNTETSDSRARYGLRSGNVIMTISGRDHGPSDVDYQFNDPHILPVHLYRAPPPAYSEIAEAKQNSTSRQCSLQGQSNSSFTLGAEITNQEETPAEAPPSYENIQHRTN